jgi:hypothetical protein
VSLWLENTAPGYRNDSEFCSSSEMFPRARLAASMERHRSGREGRQSGRITARYASTKSSVVFRGVYSLKMVFAAHSAVFCHWSE